MYLEQLKLEQEMISAGSARTLHSFSDARSRGEAHDTPIIKHSITHLTDTLAEVLTETLAVPLTRGRHLPILCKGSYLRLVDPNAAMYITLSTLFNMLLSNKRDGKAGKVSVQALGVAVGKSIEDELRFSRFESGFPEYYRSLEEDWSRRGVRSIQHKVRALVNRANELEDGWSSWSRADKLRMGEYLIGIVIQNCDMFEQTAIHLAGKPSPMKGVQFSEFGLAWIESEEYNLSLFRPVSLPMIATPEDWTSMYSGGYYSPKGVLNFPFVKRSHKSDHKAVTKLINRGDAKELMNAVNVIQRKPWVVNKTVLDVMTHVYENNLGVGVPNSEPTGKPVTPKELLDKPSEELTPDEVATLAAWRTETREWYTDDAKRVSKAFLFLRALQLARKFSDYDAIYFPHNLCFRSRVYAASEGLSPQGSDAGKGLLQNKRSKPLTDRGWYWLRVHLANLFGEDKISFDDRSAWSENNHSMFMAIGTDPIANYKMLEGADKPWQALNACLDYAQAQTSGVSWTSVALDGSCNGLQHYSALFRDATGASAVNLTDHDIPADVYTDVLNVLRTKVNTSTCDSDVANTWRSLFASDIVTRKLTKRSVMTMPYGVTIHTVVEHVREWLSDVNVGDRKYRSNLAKWLTPLLWEAIGEVVVAARVGMQWLQDVSIEQSKLNSKLHWTTPIGFPIIQDIRKVDTDVIVRTKFFGKLSLVCDTDNIDARKQRSGIAPNFTHGNDATHLALTVNENPDLDYWVVHDSYGTHASDIDELHTNIRKAFHTMYDNYNEYDLIADLNTDVPPPPLGDYDLNNIFNATYFFG
jgi:DNA-directed RNA polymerase